MDSGIRRGLGVALIAAVVALVGYAGRDNAYLGLAFYAAYLTLLGVAAFIGVRLLLRRH